MDFWNKINRDATRLFNAQQYYLACRKYSEALERAYFLFNRWDDYEESLTCLVVSLQGLSESHVQLSEFETAGSVILRGHRLIMSLIKMNPQSGLKRDALEKTQKQLVSYIGYLLAEYPEIEICDHCFLNIFGYHPHESETYNRKVSTIQ